MDGMVVVELANVLAGPSVGQFLGELGARVIKVESIITKGDVTRTWKLNGETSDVTSYFSSINLGKESIALDLSLESHLDVVHRLVQKADCVIASFKPGDAEKLKVDAETLLKMNPRLVHATISGYGLDDARPGYDAVIQAEAGFQYINGEPDGPPCKMPVALIDVLTGHQLKEAILVELWRREKTGKGGAVNVSLFATAVSSLVNQASGYVLNAVEPKRIGSDHPNIVPYGTVFDTLFPEQQIIIGVGSNSQFEALCKILGIEFLSCKESKFYSNFQRCEHREELKNILRARIGTFKREDIVNALSSVNVPVGGINKMSDVFANEKAKELIVYDGSHPIGLRQIAFKGSPEGLDAPILFTKPPHYGEHTQSILQDMLGMNHEQIKEIMKK